MISPRPRPCAPIRVFVSLLFLATATLLLDNQPAYAQSNEEILHIFDQSDLPWAGVTLDKEGNVYGTSSYGGAYHHGAVYEATHNPDGSWSYALLYSFHGAGDPNTPYSGVVFDSAGNLYGSTPFGGAFGNGAVYELSPTGNGGWIESILYSFPSSFGATGPYGGLVVDSAGNLYGSVARLDSSCAFENGGIFQLRRTSSGWKESTLYRFCGTNNGGWGPGPVSLDSFGNIYVGLAGGQQGAGMVFRLSRNGSGWKPNVLAQMSYEVGNPTSAPFAFDRAGNIYGVGNGSSAGTIFVLTLAQGKWQVHLLYSFTGTEDGALPTGVALGSNGVLYGVTSEYGEYGVYGGTAFSLSRSQQGKWTLNVLHSFGDTRVGDGYSPYGVVTLDASSNLYGTTFTGTNSCCLSGTIFKITP